MQASPSSPASLGLPTSQPTVEDSERQRISRISFSDDMWPEVDLETACGPLASAKLKDADWGQANYRLYGAFSALHLNRLGSQISEIEREIRHLYFEAKQAGSKDVPEALNDKINQLMDASLPKILTYKKLMILHSKTVALEEPSKRHLNYQRRFEEARILAAGVLGDFSEDLPVDEFRSLVRRDPWLTWGDTVGQIIHALTKVFKRRDSKVQRKSEVCDGVLVTQISRHKVNPYVFVLLTLILVLLFLAPIPIALFRVLSVPSTLVLLMAIEIMFTMFFIASFPHNFDALLVVSIAYGGLMWSSTSNWVSLG